MHAAAPAQPTPPPARKAAAAAASAAPRPARQLQPGGSRCFLHPPAHQQHLLLCGHRLGLPLLLPLHKRQVSGCEEQGLEAGAEGDCACLLTCLQFNQPASSLPSLLIHPPIHAPASLPAVSLMAPARPACCLVNQSSTVTGRTTWRAHPRLWLPSPRQASRRRPRRRLLSRLRRRQDGLHQSARHQSARRQSARRQSARRQSARRQQRRQSGRHQSGLHQSGLRLNGLP